MTQQINLYARAPEERKGPLVISVLIVAGFAGLLILYWSYLRAQGDATERRLAQARSQFASEKAVVDAMKAQLAARMDPKRLAAELAALKTRATESQEVIDRLRRGELGTLDGFGPQFVALARIGEQGIWLTGVRISAVGRSLELEGRSLEAEAVIRYAGQVNQQMGPFGTQVGSLELTPVSRDASAARAVNFKLF
jgi:hypothetical protein